MIKIGNPQPLFLDARGALSDGGFIFVGQPNADPEEFPLAVYWDVALTIPADQPLHTSGGLIVNGATPSAVFAGEADYSMRQRDSDGSQVFYAPSVFNDTSNFQPIDSDLTAIAALSTTPYGRNLLTLADQAALRLATGIPDPLPKAGGTVSSYIYRQGSGPFIHWADATYTGDTIYVTDANGSDPTATVGDLWFKVQS